MIAGRVRKRNSARRRRLRRKKTTNLTPNDAALLDVAPGGGVLAWERISFLAGGEPIEFTKSFYRGEAYDAVADLSLGPLR